MSISIDKSGLRYYGGKQQMMKHLLPLFPEHRRYVSVFGGGAADICAKRPSRVEVYNDVDNRLATCFRVIQKPQQLGRLCSLVSTIPLGRQIHADLSEAITHGSGDPVNVAFAVYYNARIAYGGQLPVGDRPKSLSVRRLSPVPKRWLKAQDHLAALAQRFQNVFIENRSCEYVLERYDGPDTFFYLDPPYVQSARKTFTNYRYEMSDAEHVRMLDHVQELRGTVMISGYPSELYDSRLSKWRRVEFKSRCTLPVKKTPRTEVVWMNYSESGQRLS